MSSEARQSCGCSGGECGDGVDRRKFLKVVGLGTAVAATGAAGQIMAGPFEAGDFEKLVPADKKLKPEWVQSLFARGSRTVYRGADLEKIGMPVGGICAGQVYLGGDGRLWHWDIFNQHIGTGADHYAKPMKAASPIEQGFALEITADGKKTVRALDRAGFSNITFTGEYPIGYVEYRDPAAPVTVSLEAFSPFVPLSAEDSYLPATVMQFTVENTSAGKIECNLAGWLQNAVCIRSGQAGKGARSNSFQRGATLNALQCGVSAESLKGQPDYGSMCLAVLAPTAGDWGSPAVSAAELPQKLFPEGGANEDAAKQNFPGKLVGAVGRKLSLAAGEKATVTFVVAWHFPNLRLPGKFKSVNGRYYAKRFASARDVADYLAANFQKLAAATRLWHDTWYVDSTLPYWFLDRTFVNTSILATSTANWFENGRFWGWEGVGCCHGTCQHVWHYAQAVGRIFPVLERTTREMVDYGLAFNPKTGVSGFRAEFDMGLAVDGQSGTILRCYREHQMSADNSFLKRNWPKIKRSIECLIEHDPNKDGILDGAQMNTLDAAWFGKIAWLSSLYVAALRAGEAMAREMGDEEFAQQARKIADAGGRNIDQQLFNGEYYFQIPDPKHAKAVGSFEGCEIDQVFGQGWAFQVGLDRVLPEEHTKTALRSLWKYNFAPDAGGYRNHYKAGRVYAMVGEAGLLMCSWPRGEKARVRAHFDFYFNECMTGFEYQAAGHMVWEGLVQEGLAVVRAIHDRYHASRRNPWNEVECGDHYARAMASYGVFLAACGFEYHGPKGHLGFAPRMSPEDFRAAFTATEGWGTLSQKRDAAGQRQTIAVKHGKLRLKTLAFAVAKDAKPAGVTVTAAGKPVECKHAVQDGRVSITLGAEAVIEAGQSLEVKIA